MAHGTARRSALSFLPCTAVLEMTYRCNHECLFCSCPWFSPESGFDVRCELSVDEWKTVIEKLCSMGVTDLAFTGGEPLLKPGLGEIVEFAAACTAEFIETVDGALVSSMRPPKLSLLSNGRIMSEEILAMCVKHGIHIGLSLPGLVTFTEHTREGRADEVLQWFARAKQVGVSTHVGITVTKKNIHELFETMAESLMAGADSVLLNRFMPGGRGIAYAQDLLLQRDDIKFMLETAEEVLRTADRRGTVGTELPRCVIDKGVHTHLNVGTRCAAGVGFFVVDPSGYTRVCNHSPVRLCHMNDIENLKAHSYWKRFVQKDYLPDSCRGCESLRICDGGCREAAHIWGGSIDSIDPLLAEERRI